MAPNPDQLRGAAEHVPAGIRVTLGASLPGIAGFRDSHTEARAAQRLLMRAPGGPRFTTYADGLLPRPLLGNGFEVRLALELMRWRGD